MTPGGETAQDMSGEDAYAVLGVAPGAEHVVIRAAYRALMHKYSSPSRIDADTAADDERARAVQRAYDLLSDPDRRDAYDRQRRDSAPPPSEPTTAPSPIAAFTPLPQEPLAPAPAAPLMAAAEPQALNEPLSSEPLRLERRAAFGAAATASAPPRRRGRTGVVLLVLVLLAGAVIAGVALLGRRGATTPEAASVSGSGLEVQSGKLAAAPVTAAKPLPCYVDGKLVGELPLAACAARNGVASGPMSVGLAASAPPPEAAAPASGPERSDSAAEPSTASPSEDTGSSTPQHIAAARAAAGASRDAAAVARLGAREAPTNRAPILDITPASADPNRTMAVVRAFYEALGDGDGARAASLVTPEKRTSGPLSARAIDGFYGNLAQPLELTSVQPVNAHTAQVRYHFVTQGGAECQGAALVSTTRRDGAVLIGGIQAQGRC